MRTPARARPRHCRSASSSSCRSTGSASTRSWAASGSWSRSGSRRSSPPPWDGPAIALQSVLTMLMAAAIQPTIGALSDYTISRWGRRKPYIAIGATLDVLFLIGIGLSNSYITLVVFLILVQFSSNFAQGPFQGYVPDLVPSARSRSRARSSGSCRPPGSCWARSSSRTASRPTTTSCRCVFLGLIELATADRNAALGAGGQARPRPAGSLVAHDRPIGLGHRHPQGAELPEPRDLAPHVPRGDQHAPRLLHPVHAAIAAPPA